MPPLRPDTLAEALDMLARPMLVQATVGGPPFRRQPFAQVMDVGRVSEMAGIHRLGDEVVVGVNSQWAALIRSTLLRPAAACLADAATLMEDVQPGGALLHALDAAVPDSPILLALTALDARMEMALRQDSERIIRQTFPLREALESPPHVPHLPLNVRFSAPLFAAGSALRQATDLSPLQPDAQAVAAFVMLNSDSGRFSFLRIVLSTPGDWPRLCPGTGALQGQEAKKEAIEAVVRLAQRNCPQPRASTPQFSLALSSHLIREALDRALARSHAT